MYLIKFTTNSNQEFINEPFKSSENKKNQQQVINQSKKIEKFTYNVVQQFIKLPEDIEDFIEGKLEGKYSSVIEFTSGKALFVTGSYDRDTIENKFKGILENEIKRANEEGNNQVISFNYAVETVSADYLTKPYSEVTKDINMVNLGASLLNNQTMFNLMMIDREGIHYHNNIELKSNPDNAISLAEVAKIEPAKKIKGRQGYTPVELVDEDNVEVYNKMFIYKLDLNNIGSFFSQIKKEKIEKYSELSIKFFSLIRSDYINKLIGDELHSKCMFAAGDDIMLIVRVDELQAIQAILNQLVAEINELCKEYSEMAVTYAGGLKIIDFRIPIRLYYDEVENELSNAKKHKEINCISFNQVAYSEQQFGETLEITKKLISLENRFSDNNGKDSNSNFYYNLVTKLQTNSEINPRLLVLNTLMNQNNQVENTIPLIFEILDCSEAFDGDQSKYIVNLLNLALYVSNVTGYQGEKVEVKQINYEEEIDKIGDIAPTAFTLLKDIEVSTGFMMELYEFERENPQAEYQQVYDNFIDIIFKKKNELFYNISPIENNIERYCNLSSLERKNTIHAVLQMIKLQVEIKKNSEIGSEDEEN